MKLTEEEAYQLCISEPRMMAKLIVKLQALQDRVDELERRLGLNSSNSSKPPSTDSAFEPKAKTTSNTKRKAGGQKGHVGNNLKMVEHPDVVIVSSPQVCRDCGASLADTKSCRVASRQVFDLPVLKIEVSEYQVHAKQCPCCKTMSKGSFPEDITAPTQYGKRFDAAISYLSIHQMLPYERITQVIEDLFGHPISEGVILNALTRVEENLSSFHTAAKKALVNANVLHADETGINVRGVLHWTHIAISENAAACLLHPKRGVEAMKEMGILPSYNGMLIHDHWKPYESIEGSFEHAFCNAHHLRELKRVSEQDHQRWSEDMSKLLMSAHQKVTYAKAHAKEALSPRMIKRFNTWYDTIVTSAHVYHAVSQKEAGKRGRLKQTFAKNLLDRLIKYKDETLRFITHFNVPFTNNAAEQGLRMMKVKEKISGCFMSQKGGRIFMNIYAYILTVKKNGVNILQALLDAMYGKPFMPLVCKNPAF